MERILAQRFSFCDFSKIVGFPNPLPSRDEWESSLPKFQGEEWEVPAEHLLKFHVFIHRLHIVHEDVQIKIFKYSLQGIAHDWCRSLPIASINSLTGFHAAFNSFCKDYFSAEYLYENCCDEFSLLYKDFACHKYHIYDEVVIVEESIFHEEHEVLNDIHYDRNNIEMSGIISDVSVVLSVHEDQHVSSEYPNVEEQVYSAEYFSPDYEAEIDEKLAAKAREDSSMFFPSFSELKAEFVCSLIKEMQRIFLSWKLMFLAVLLMIKKLFQILTKNNQLLMNIPAKMMKSRDFPWFLFMMSMNLILGRAMEEKRRS
jgi:hypothetical protein